jgi:hypothetical protein
MSESVPIIPDDIETNDTLVEITDAGRDRGLTDEEIATEITAYLRSPQYLYRLAQHRRGRRNGLRLIPGGLRV